MAASKEHPVPPAPPWRFLIIDRYLLRQFVQSFVICFCSLTGLYIVIDGFGNLEEFINEAHKQGSLMTVMGEYYAYRSLSFFDLASPVLTLIAAMFTVTWIQRHNELTALQAAGIPKARIMRSVIVAAAVIVGLSVANREFVIPRVRSHLSFNAQNLGGRNGKMLQPRYDNATVVWLGGNQSRTYAAEQRIEKPDFYLPSGLDRYGARLTAANAFYRPAEGDRPAGYLFEHVELPAGLASQTSIALGNRPVIITPRDAAWLKEDECFVASEVSFEQLAGGSTWQQFSSTFELIQSLRNRSLDFGAEARMAIHARIMQPVLNMTLLFLGLPLVLARSNRNVFVAIGWCVGLVVAFMLVTFTCQYLGTNYWFEPALAAWLPAMIFIPCAVAMSQPFRE
ncbi:MAG TPA: LptF/LptG family permease [Pirellulales bacterium]|nr:LptF/LptG family permease [Pirellulales bacterium]